MTEKAEKYLADVLQAIALIERFSEEVTDFFEYQKDLKTKSAIERQLAFIDKSICPDASVVCRPYRVSGQDRNALTNPVLLVEILSESTANYDPVSTAGGTKFHYSTRCILRRNRRTIADRLLPWLIRNVVRPLSF